MNENSTVGTDAAGTGIVPLHKAPEAAAPRRKIAIVGFTPTRVDAPYDDLEWEVWGLNALYSFDDVRRTSRWFDLHESGIIPAERITQYAAMKVPVYMQEVHPKVPTSVRFPKPWIEQRLGSRYFTNSISWMQGLALAELLERFPDEMDTCAVHIYGVDMSTPDEYQTQRACVEYWLGRTEGTGAEVHVPPGSDLIHSLTQYGFGDDNGFRLKLKERIADFDRRIKEANVAINQHQTEINKLVTMRNTLEGARQNTEWTMKSWTVLDHRSAEGSKYHDSVGAAPAAAPAAHGDQVRQTGN